MWTIVFHERRGDPPHQGSAATREEAMEAFRRAWDAGKGQGFRMAGDVTAATIGRTAMFR